MAKVSFHRVRLVILGAALASVIIGMLAYGMDYYRLDLKDRVASSKHSELRPGGSAGVKLGMLGVALFCCLYAYPIRKRWKFLQRIGKTKNWLDFHVLFGISAPLIITVHSSFKLQGLAGVAYWLMMAVMASGFIGRYLYAQIPRRLDAVALTLDEVRDLCTGTRTQISRQNLFTEDELLPVLAASDLERIESLSVIRAFALMMWIDLRRPFQLAALRRRSSTSWLEILRTAGGLLTSSNHELEQAVHLVRRESWLLAKMSFLGKANHVFRLWHVVHRPFSYSFVVLAMIHITLVLLLGYY